DALYTAAVCHERLANYNPYWREIYGKGLHAGERMVTYANVKATYPKYQLPRGTSGWQPSTRTVNNGPGWAAAPKPPPRLSRTARVKLLIGRVADRLYSFWRLTGKRWLMELLIFVGFLLTARITSKNRRRLRLRVARYRMAQDRGPVSDPGCEMFWICPLQSRVFEQVRRWLGEKSREFIGLAMDRRIRPVLVRTVVSYSVMVGLLLELMRTLWSG
ncbi:MAG TPA: hypothetical protein VKB46_14685, partial [Pyrinomonadaceae bacterium]|nr:hypothetical protein [Pyrinomonadaceae bacterium]